MWSAGRFTVSPVRRTLRSVFPEGTTVRRSFVSSRRSTTSLGHPFVLSSLARQQGKQKSQFRLRNRFQSTSTSGSTAAATETVPEPAYADLRLVAITTSIPFVGFGIMDNAVMIVAGDAIDASLGIYLGMSTMCAAAIGNIISDLVGIGFGSMIEDFCANTLKLPVPNITSAQRTLRSVRSASNIGMAIGMTIGCIIGMFPLLFIDSNKVEHMKKKAHLEALFQDVVQEAKTLIDAESTCLYLRVNIDPKKGKTGVHSDATLEHFQPDVEGEHFYAMKYDLPQTSSASSPDREDGPRTTTKLTSRLIPIGKGIISRAALTGEAWVISDLKKEPDFLPAIREQYGGEIPDQLKHMLVVPVLDGQGRTIAVIRALNKKASSGKNGFTDTDVQILKNLASHITVSLQSFFRDEDKEEMRLRDTIRLLKQHGLDGMETPTPRNIGIHSRPSLFPANQGEKE